MSLVNEFEFNTNTYLSKIRREILNVFIPARILMRLHDAIGYSAIGGPKPLEPLS